MFKKRKPVEQPRDRQRAAPQASPNATVFSYHANRSTQTDPRDRQMDEPEERPRRKRAKISWLRPQNLGIAASAILILLLAVSLSGTPKVIITSDESSRIFSHDLASYQQTAKKLLTQSAWNGNKLTINTDTITHELEAAYPEIQTATITLPVFGRQPIVYIQPAVPQMILATQHDGQFVLDSSGRALVAVTTKLSLPSGANALPVISDESGLGVKVGQIALPQQSVAFVAEIAGQLRAKQITVSSWRMPAAASELDVTIAGAPYYVRFNLQGDARAEAGTYLATKSYLIDGKHVTPAQYIDARVIGRVYYQ